MSLLLQIATTNASSTNSAPAGKYSLAGASDHVQHLIDTLEDMGAKYGLKILVALLILIVGMIVARWISGLVQRSLEKQQMEPPIKTLLVRVVRLLIMMGVTVVALDTAGFPVTTVIAGIGVAGVGLGLALQGVLGNLVAGLTIIFTKPFRVGEYVELAGVYGQVKNIELFSTVLTHADMSAVIIPNRKIVGEILHNYGKIRQLDLSVGVGYSSNLPQVLSLLREIVTTNPRVLKDPAPGIGITALSDCSINIAVKPWTSVADYGAAQAEIYQAILDRFRAQKIEIPFPQREVRLLNNP
jgi:small conductance mechanosensitive channel